MTPEYIEHFIERCDFHRSQKLFFEKRDPWYCYQDYIGHTIMLFIVMPIGKNIITSDEARLLLEEYNRITPDKVTYEDIETWHGTETVSRMFERWRSL